jgi:hypothetical protein
MVPRMTPEDVERLVALAEAMKPTSAEDWGSDRQTAADLALWTAIDATAGAWDALTLGDEAREGFTAGHFETWALKATSDEIADEVIRCIRAANDAAAPDVRRALAEHEASGTHENAPECVCAARCAFCNVEHFPTFHDGGAR